ncbi:MAG TPA: host attachment protein, partial [Burkholderiaceae bacterium]|nr:host attachment protein [Burkholderiaceae bacterium]
MPAHWVLVADRTRARLFATTDTGKSFNELEDIAHAEGRMASRELRTDAQGRFYGKGERQQAHTAPPHVSAAEHETERYAKLIAERLDIACVRHEFDRLHLVAPPEFLGELRGALDETTRAHAGGEVAKNYVNLPDAELKP